MLFCCHVDFCLAQNDRGFAGLSVGMATPLGDFGDNSPLNRNAGLANIGTALEINAGIKLGKYLGIAGMLRRQSHGIDDATVASSFSGFGSIPSIESSKYQFTSFMTGLYGSFALNDHLNLDVCMAMGVAILGFPRVDITRSSGINQPEMWRIASRSTESLAFDVGVCLRHHLSKKLSMRFGVDFWSSSPRFRESGIGNTGTSGPVRTVVHLSTLNASLGAGYRF